MMTRLLLLGLSALFFFPIVVKAQHYSFSDTAIDAYFKAYELNEKKEYLLAFNALKTLDSEMNHYLSLKGETATMLDEAEFLMPYWAVKKSLGEVAYKLGLYKEMDVYTNNMMELLGKYNFHNAADYRSCLADVYRIKGNSHYLQGLYTEAEKFLLKAMLNKPDDHDFVDATRDDLAQAYYQQGLYAKAILQLDSILTGHRYKDNARISGAESLRQDILSQRALCLARTGNYDEAYASLQRISDYFKRCHDDRGRAEALRKTAKILMLRYDDTGVYNSQALQYYKEYLALTRRFIDQNFVHMTASEREQYWLAEQPFATDCYRLGDKDAAFLFDVALFCKAILLQMNRKFKPDMTMSQRKRTLSSMRTTWRDVKKALPKGAAAIEFITYEKKGKTFFGALVMRKECKKPIFVDIISKDSLLSYSLENDIPLRLALTSDKAEMKDHIYQNRGLSSLVWNRDMVNAIGKSTSVYFAADDLLHLLAIEYLLPPSLGGIPFYRMTSTRLLAERSHKAQMGKALFCGGIEYTCAANEEEMGAGNDKAAYYRMTHEAIGLPYLEGSLREVDSISALRNNHGDSILTGAQASEGVLRSLMGRYPVVHISTHGYFSAPKASPVSDLLPAPCDEQLSSSCLFLACSQNNIDSNVFNPDYYDGILSARELAEQDLSKVNLLVLAACQSGLGYISTDGVYGLQRGLKTAGVKAIIASLWSVDDKATTLLMQALYKNLKQGESLHDAFYNARQYLKTTTIRKHYHRAQRPDLVVEKKYDLPRYSDAFILIDGYE